MNPPHRPRRKPKAESSGDPLLWIVVIGSVAALALVGYSKFIEYREAEAVTAANGAITPGVKQTTTYFGDDEPYTPADPGMEPGSVQSMDAASDDLPIKSAAPASSIGKKAAPREYGSDCDALQREQGDIEERLRRPHGAQQNEAFTAQLREIAEAMQKARCQ